ncbi:MAG: diaminohydroxyphosphoribosylaminopyrimidine deaminase [Flavobacteriales bacterium]|nr:diaminohydroxyphosphoribosylaminopyrimidine deaminase [Flavobacteriales bacterium]
MNSKQNTVLVTGANGYLASWIVKKLLIEGHNVHATVRDIHNKEKINHLLEYGKKYKGNIKFFSADLIEKNSFDEAMRNCSIIFHTASPFKLEIKDSIKELINPALDGTKNVFSSADKVDSIKKIVLTSSVAAMYTDASECKNLINNEITELVWNKTASVNYQPYSYSKTLAEKEAWRLYKKQRKWELVVINPSLVLGPFPNATQNTSESINLLKQIGDGTFKIGVPKMPIGVVDVRDVADAHYEAAFNKNASGRYITSAYNTSFLEISKLLNSEFGDSFPIPKRPLPKWLVFLIGPLLNKALTRKYIRNNFNKDFRANNNKIQKELGINFRPLKQTLIESFQSLIDQKII